MSWLDRYKAPKENVWQGRMDHGGKRIHEVVTCLDLTKSLPEQDQSFVILGFGCDEGVRRNQGRPGAVKGPASFRSVFGSLAAHTILGPILDAGDIVCLDGDLEAAQDALGEVVTLLKKAGHKVLVVGGGHETAFGHYKGFAGAGEDGGLSIANFDAHFDLRPLLQGGQGSSGTPFRQVADLRQSKGQEFSYYCYGIQPFGNHQGLFKTADELGVKWCDAEHMIVDPGSTLALAKQQIAEAKGIYLTLCLDVFHLSTAPGVSAPQALGVFPHHAMPILKLIAGSGKLKGADIVELAPCFDVEQSTAKLAGGFAATLMSCWT